MAKAHTTNKAPRKQGFKRSGHSMNPERPTEGLKGVAKVRTKATIKRLQMYRNQRPKRNRAGKIISPAPFQGWNTSGTTSRVEPSQRWFGNSRVISQNALQKFQNELGTAMKDPYKVVMKPTQLPITLLQQKAANARVHLLDTESFENVFGPKKIRKRPNLAATSYNELKKLAEDREDTYNKEKDSKDYDLVREDTGVKDAQRDWVMSAGQSKRIWNELYKVIDSSDVILQILDARDPMGTRSPPVEKYLKTEKPYKHLIFILNKVDLVPTWVTQRWVTILSKEYPTVAFHASLTHPFGKGSLINLLRQFAKLHVDKKQISVGFIGYPNTGKSSIINTLRSKKVCKVAPIAGETKVWQYITLMRRIYLIDCPGVVYPSTETDTEKVLKGVVRVELVQNPEDYIVSVLERVKPEYIRKTYKINVWIHHVDFLEKLARRSGKLLKKGEPDIAIAARMVLNDWQRGKLPFYVAPVGYEEPLSNQTVNINETVIIQDNVLKITDNKEAQETDNLLSKEIKNQLTVTQDFRKIRVGLPYSGDDVKTLEQDKSFSESIVEDDSSVESESELENSKSEDVNTKNDSCTIEDKSDLQVTENLDDQDSVNDSSNNDDNVLNDNADKKDYDMNQSNEYSDTEFLSIAQDNLKQSVFDVIDNEYDSSDTEMFSSKTVSSNDIQSVSSMSRKKTKEILTSKQRRAIERASKRKKIGSNFYEVTNVKNRNKDRKVPKVKRK
ncbi:Nucleolar GTP-binding protein 2 [Trachymyrmex septentrionalis]|uniref:Nucleolar GTP-binding protein 2 n=1 Tax=Trachymyrmex septentrionalis TaxID=34720 RepID=A0A195FHY1_9HYME|nr:PREDICTED: nucleolar GTP-binding protein 2 [Trachymyrmex septentrionalis]XP_018341152.1 PREDICTED: nucleolar GTP-binding protein 2 [Trachymyrmex septentrionalis]XP_018341153.1 PREDICTED: nucleolar GTP-binding protein 2 [Trachymyrmex septentrionalis]XP_018341154.1 PREDICTED: nucleolar GTP-binding protein 2 [Trachymyrmex septentrionalis]XP_018341155.1 PREDICTED: nucleolar GTP-binding protein 2 [Trachymyrmex septentrionalis]XP_018341156.1 PREDICTED: nucleolar GTP-binding protein 2 [Trachymyrme